MSFTNYPDTRPRFRFSHEPSEQVSGLAIGLSLAASCVFGGLLLDLNQRPKPVPHRRVSVIDMDSNKNLIFDVPYVSEERWGDHQYFFRFRGGGERFLDLRGINYRIIRRDI